MIMLRIALPAIITVMLAATPAACFSQSQAGRRNVPTSHDDRLAVRLSAADTTIGQGDSLSIVPFLVNTSQDTIRIIYNPSSFLDLEVYRNGERIEWRERFGLDTLLEYDSISPGARYTGVHSTPTSPHIVEYFTLTFEQPGRYRIVGTARLYSEEDVPDVTRLPPPGPTPMIRSEPIEVVVK